MPCNFDPRYLKVLTLNITFSCFHKFLTNFRHNFDVSIIYVLIFMGIITRNA